MKITLLCASLSVLMFAFTPAANADNLLIQRVANEQGVSLPKRGSSMAQVQSKFGAPQQKVAAIGGGSKRTPPISRWIYPTFSVYFENSHVVDAVLNKADPNETGPVPAKK
jgi:hypothetical protein